MASGRRDADGRRRVLRLLAAALVAALGAGLTRLPPGPPRRRGAPDDPPGREARHWRRL